MTTIDRGPQSIDGLITLVPLVAGMVTDAYADWMNDRSVVQYTESRGLGHTVASLVEYVGTVAASGTAEMFGIFVDGIHVGNIKITYSGELGDTADVGLIVGRVRFRGGGVGTEAVRMIVDHARSRGVRTLWAGAYSRNIASIRVFEKNGFEETDRRPGSCLADHRPLDVVILTLELER